jgi:uroporphyrin-III C-methyltransferase
VPSPSQADINRLLVAHALRGRTVVRLKGGDPFVFGRGGEEAEALARAGVDFDVVPGVSAGTGVAARAGIPLTHRDVASSVAFVTAEESRDKEREPVDWRALARAADTIVVFMCARSVARVAARLVEAGRAPSTPVAIVSRGTRTGEVVRISTLGALAAIPDDEAAALAPALAIVGEVVSHRVRLAEVPVNETEVTYDEIVA